MTSRRKILRRWLVWHRWTDRCIALAHDTVSTRGCERAYNRWARMENARANGTWKRGQ